MFGGMRRAVLALCAAALGVSLASVSAAEDRRSESVRWMIFGTMLYKQGNLQDAERSYRKAAALDPANTEAWQGLGNVLTDENEVDEAGKAYARARPGTSNATPDAVTGAVSSPTPAPIPRQAPVPKQTPSSPPSAAEAPPSRFALGIGYPDFRLRTAVLWGWDVEAKGAFAQGLQAYSGRLVWNYVDLGPLKLTLGGEGGVVELDGADSLNGSGPFAEGFLGVEYPLGRFRLSLDVGEASMSASSQGHTYSTTDVIYNTALYIYLF